MSFADIKKQIEERQRTLPDTYNRIYDKTDGYHEQLFSATTHISTLFLGAWITLYQVANPPLDFSRGFPFDGKIDMAIACLLHLLAILIVVVINWISVITNQKVILVLHQGNQILSEVYKIITTENENEQSMKKVTELYQKMNSNQASDSECLGKLIRFLNKASFPFLIFSLLYSLYNMLAMLNIL